MNSHTPPPRLSDPAAAPRFGYDGNASREKPLLDEQPIGPMRGRVTVTPVKLLDRRVWFEVAAEWGPYADGAPVIGILGDPTNHVADSVAIANEQHARRLAYTAIEQLRTPPPDRIAVELNELVHVLGLERFNLARPL
jgi:hypothetical protein